MMGGWKSGRIENILISLIFVWWEWKSGVTEKVSLFKFTHILSLKNLCPIKKKISNKKTKKKCNHPNLIKKITSKPKKNKKKTKKKAKENTERRRRATLDIAYPSGKKKKKEKEKATSKKKEKRK